MVLVRIFVIKVLFIYLIEFEDFLNDVHLWMVDLIKLNFVIFIFDLKSLIS